MAEIVNVRLRTDTLARLDAEREAYGLARARWIELAILAALESGWTPTGKQPTKIVADHPGYVG